MTDTSSNSPAPTQPVPSTPPANKRSIGKLIFKLFVALVLLFVVGLVALYVAKESLVRRGVIYGGEYATEQKTALQQANLSLFGGALKLSAMDIANLPNFKEGKLMVMKSCETTLDTSTIFNNEIVVKEIYIDGLELTLETNGNRNNVNELMEILKKKSPAAGAGSSAEAKGRTLRIAKLRLTGTKVHIRAAPVNLDLNLGDIVMIEPTNPDGRPMKIADVVARIFLNVSKQALEDPQFPAALKDSMKNVTATIDNLKGSLEDGVKQFETVGKDLGKGLQDAGKSLEDAGKNLQNLNPFAPKTAPK